MVKKRSASLRIINLRVLTQGQLTDGVVQSGLRRHLMLVAGGAGFEGRRGNGEQLRLGPVW